MKRVLNLSWVPACQCTPCLFHPQKGARRQDKMRTPYIQEKSSWKTRHLLQSGTWLMTHCMADTPQHRILEMISTTHWLFALENDMLQEPGCSVIWRLPLGVTPLAKVGTTSPLRLSPPREMDIEKKVEWWNRGEATDDSDKKDEQTTAVTTARHKKGDDWLVVSNIYYFP